VGLSSLVWGVGLFRDPSQTVMAKPSTKPRCPSDVFLNPRRGPGRALGSLGREATWLILPVVICLSQRLSHAGLSMS
jgi:hypothetical protein